MNNLHSILFAMAPPAGGNQQISFIEMVMPLAIVFGIFYFIVIRPQIQQRKQHEEMMKSLKKGDKIITTGGLHGSIVSTTDNILKVRIADHVSVQISRNAVAVKLGEEKE